MTTTTPVPECGPLCAAALHIMRGETAPADHAEQLRRNQFRESLDLGSGKQGALSWAPVTKPAGHTVGYIKLETPDDVTVYSLAECPMSVGRGFFLTKARGAGRDKRRGGYAVDCEGGRAVRCECSGYTARKVACKHMHAVTALLQNEWV